ncbi:hypothetical protein SBOR_7860 [Sclerotinia borealis F-4128]|uniref:Uncharacterized protein n=1 Tax=Sclerotinia borealis (strain F-4128) TaxID=1432307 RepID=W9C7K6_SCLBF|nr:hypothetical protein SBOR_7860 [Sclerotinia borealis F-4128]
MRSILLIPCLFLAQIFAAPAPYIVTSYVELSIYTYEAAETLQSTTYSAELQTLSVGVIPNATPVTNAIKTVTDSSAYAHVTIIEVLLPPGSGHRPTSTYDYFATTTTPSTSYVVPITYTAYPSCTGTGQNWTYITNVPIYLPTIIASLLTPSTLTTSASTYTYYDDRISVQTVVQAILDPSDIAADALVSASSAYIPYSMEYCYTPTTTCTTYLSTATCTPTWVYPSSRYTSGSGSGSGSSSNSYNYNDEYSCDEYYCGDNALLLIAICVPVGWVVLWLLVGLFESWLSFKGIMLGKNRKRGIPYAWCCISMLFLCCTGPTYKAKSVEEQERLGVQWKEMGVGKKLGLWFKWGFRWKYPDMLGDEPEKNKRAFREGCL